MKRATGQKPKTPLESKNHEWCMTDGDTGPAGGADSLTGATRATATLEACSFGA